MASHASVQADDTAVNMNDTVVAKATWKWPGAFTDDFAKNAAFVRLYPTRSNGYRPIELSSSRHSAIGGALASGTANVALFKGTRCICDFVRDVAVV